MKIEITENDIHRMVMSSVNKILNENFSNRIFEEDDNDDNRSFAQADTKKKQKVIQYLSRPEADVAQFAYKLWPDKEKDSCRSYFYKCLNGEKDDNGNAYDFSSDEINRIYSMISNSGF